MDGEAASTEPARDPRSPLSDRIIGRVGTARSNPVRGALERCESALMLGVVTSGSGPRRDPGVPARRIGAGTEPSLDVARDGPETAEEPRGTA
jgi:hypothetical protein